MSNDISDADTKGRVIDKELFSKQLFIQDDHGFVCGSLFILESCVVSGYISNRIFRGL